MKPKVMSSNWGWGKEETVSEMSKYLPIACVITAQARMRLVDFVGKNYKFIAYCDTDSMKYLQSKAHLFPLQTTSNLGDWHVDSDKLEDLVLRTKKQYREKCSVNGTKFVFASISSNADNITSEDMVVGKNIPNQLRKVYLRGGVALVNSVKKMDPIWSPQYLAEETVWFYTRRNVGESREDHIKRLKILYYKNHDKQLEKIKALDSN